MPFVFTLYASAISSHSFPILKSCRRWHLLVTYSADPWARQRPCNLLAKRVDKNKEWKKKSSHKPPTDCQLDALRYLGNGSEATTCGVCNSTDYLGIVPESCRLFENASLDNLWDPTDCKLEFLAEICLVLDQATLTISDSLLSSQQWKGKLTRTAQGVPFQVLLQSPHRHRCRIVPLLSRVLPPWEVVPLL